MKHYAGLDLSMETTQVCIVDETVRRIASVVESTPDMIARALREAGGVERAEIEIRRMSPATCHGLRTLGIPVICIDARQAHQSLKANKIDPHDAAGLAQFGQYRVLQGGACQVSRRPRHAEHHYGT